MGKTESQCGGLGQPQAIDVLDEWLWPKSLRVTFAAGPGPNLSICACALKHWKTCHNLSDVDDRVVHTLIVSQTLNGAPQQGGRPSPCEAQRLWHTSACSATAALNTAETLTVCCFSMLSPHFHSHYLQYPKTTDVILPGQEQGFKCVSVLIEKGGPKGCVWGWGCCVIVPKTGTLILTRIL